VTVGNSRQAFARLLHAVEAYFVEHDSGADVFMQIGVAEIHPRVGSAMPFLELDEFKRRIQSADVIVCHAGAGTLFDVLQAGKCPVVMPRRRAFDEIVDDHQVEFTQYLADAGKVIPAWEPADVPRAIGCAMQSSTRRDVVSPRELIESVRRDIWALSR
jgi:UDP-N-acetylglucosamine transferase subunit ALG13